MRVIGYRRVSTLDQAEEGISLDAQAARIADWCQRNGHEAPRIETDEGLSGKRADNRPALQRALEAVCRERGVLVVYSLSRLCRSTRDALDIAERIKRAGAHLVSITEQIDTTCAMGEFFFTVMAALGQLERRLIGERTSEALRHKRRNGFKTGGTTPYGYTVGLADDGETKMLLPVEDEQRIIAAIVRRNQAGDGYTALAQWLNRDCVPTRTGAPWSAKVVRGILLRTETIPCP